MSHNIYFSDRQQAIRDRQRGRQADLTLLFMSAVATGPIQTVRIHHESLVVDIELDGPPSHLTSCGANDLVWVPNETRPVSRQAPPQGRLLVARPHRGFRPLDSLRHASQLTQQRRNARADGGRLQQPVSQYTSVLVDFIIEMVMEQTRDTLEARRRIQDSHSGASRARPQHDLAASDGSESRSSTTSQEDDATEQSSEETWASIQQQEGTEAQEAAHNARMASAAAEQPRFPNLDDAVANEAENGGLKDLATSMFEGFVKFGMAEEQASDEAYSTMQGIIAKMVLDLEKRDLEESGYNTNTVAGYDKVLITTLILQSMVDHALMELARDAPEQQDDVDTEAGGRFRQFGRGVR